MPASVSSLIPSWNTCPELVAERIRAATSGLLDAFTTLPDPRKRRGRRHEVASVVAVAVAAILTGARSYAAIWAWAVDAPLTVKTLLGVGSRVPCESTFRRVLQQLDPEVLDGVVCAWLAARTDTTDTTDRPVGRRVIAVDGKTVRGARSRGGAQQIAPHLVAAFDQTAGAVLGQVAVAAKSNEIPAVRTLLASFDLTNAVVSMDAMHAQSETAAAITNAGGHYLVTAKGNQPTLRAACKDLPWADVPSHTAVDTGHGRRVRRTIKVVDAPPAGSSSPARSQSRRSAAPSPAAGRRASRSCT